MSFIVFQGTFKYSSVLWSVKIKAFANRVIWSVCGLELKDGGWFNNTDVR